jgi:hypothetical protein
MLAMTKRFAAIAAALTAVPLLAAAPTAAAPNQPAYHWTVLPDAPIHAHGDAAGVWTGTQLLVWGGQGRNGHDYATGASWTPATHTWSKLPTSPLSPRYAPASVWTGSSWFLWGGWAGMYGDRRPADGALYDPATRTWTSLPAAPVTRYRDAQAYLVGSKVVLVTTTERAAARRLRADVYNPATNAWTALPSLRLSKRHANAQLTGVAAGPDIYLQSAWSYDIEHAHSGEIHSGVDGYTLDPSAGTWTPNTIKPRRGMTSYQALWTGSHVILPDLDIWCGVCPHPMAMGRSGMSFNPATGTRHKIPHGPVDDLEATYVYNDGLLFGVNTQVIESGPHVHHRPGEAALWNPATRTWTSLPRAPHAGYDDPVIVAAGSGLFVWGPMSGTSGASGERLAR